MMKKKSSVKSFVSNVFNIHLIIPLEMSVWKFSVFIISFHRTRLLYEKEQTVKIIWNHIFSSEKEATQMDKSAQPIKL